MEKKRGVKAGHIYINSFNRGGASKEKIDELKEEAREFLKKKHPIITYAKCCLLCGFYSKDKETKRESCRLHSIWIDSHMKCKNYTDRVLEGKKVSDLTRRNEKAYE